MRDRTGIPADGCGLEVTYPGGKAACFRQIVNQMPPHRTYIETHLGGGGVFLNKRPADRSVGIDIDQAALDLHGDAWRDGRIELVRADAATWLRNMPREVFSNGLVYCDPPYVREARKSQRDIYRHEYTTAQHIELLNVLLGLDCYVMVSGYASLLYEEALHDWRRVEFTAGTRAGPATEVLWMNYTEPGALHDYRFVGADYRERQDIKRKQARWKKRLSALSSSERAAMINVLLDLGTPAAPALLPRGPRK